MLNLISKLHISNKVKFNVSSCVFAVTKFDVSGVYVDVGVWFLYMLCFSFYEFCSLLV